MNGSPVMAPPLRTGTAPGPAARVTAEVARSFDAPVPGPAAWDELVDLSGGSVYQTREWLSSWWDVFGSGRRAHIVLFRDGGRVVGIAPFFEGAGDALRLIGSGAAFGSSRGIFLDDGPSDYLDVIVDPAYGEAVGRAMAEHAAGTGARSIEMVNLPPAGPAMRFVVPALLEAGRFEVTVSDGDVCSGIAVTRPLADFIRSLDSTARRRYNQASRTLAEGDGGVSLRTADAGNWTTMYADLVRLHQARWNRAGFPGLFRSTESAAFQERAARALAERGRTWFAALYDGDRCIAARLGFVFRGRMYDYLSGFDDSPAAAKKRPGMALLLRMYHDAFAGGVTTLDLLRGDEKYKAELTSERVVLRNVIARPAGGDSAAARITGTARLAGFLAAREVRLLGVQVSQHGLVRGAASYLKFRAQRFSNKFTKGKDSQQHD